MPLIQAGSKLTAALLNLLGIAAVIKPTDQSVTSSTVLVNDNALTLPVAASGTYVFAAYLDFEGGTGGASDLKFQWAVPAGAALSYNCVHVNASGSTIISSRNAASSTITAETSGAATHLSLLMFGTLVVSTTAGSLTLEWAQNTGSGTATIVHAGSAVGLWRVT